MTPIARSFFLLFLVFTLLLSLAACGGGDGGRRPIDVVDPASSYTGVKTAAVVTSANGEDLATGAYIGGQIGAAIANPKATAEAATRHARPIQQAATVMNTSLRRMQIPRLAKQRATARVADGEKKAAKLETYQVPGEQGGYATFAIDINEADGTFSGTVVYNNFASGGLTLSGTTDVLGTLDRNYGGFTRLTLSFRELSLGLGSYGFTLIGSLSWGYDPAAVSDSLTVNMVLVDSGKTYWFSNYHQVNVYGSNSVTQTLTGRYYDADAGYVEMTTPTPLVVYYGNSWPSGGEVKFSGEQGAWVSIGFQPQMYSVSVDVDNNQSVDWQAERQTNNQPPPNTSPVADAGPDRTTGQTAWVALDGTGSYDAENDQLSYYWSVESSPGGTSPQLADFNTATASFAAEAVGTYVLRLYVTDGRYASSFDTVTVTVTAAAPAEPGLLQQQWQYGLFGTSIGQAGLLSTDLDGDGTPEIIASASSGGYWGNSSWYVLQRTSTGDYQQIWRSKNYSSGIARLLLADVTADGKDDVLVGLSDGTVEVYSGVTLQLVRSISTASGLVAMALGDLDGDGGSELVTSDGTKVNVYSAQSGALKWTLAAGGGSSIAVGNVDADPALEIVATTFGGKGYVIGGVTKAISWDYLNGFGAKVALGDLDGDGMQEIVGASSWSRITVFDADRATPVWEITASQDIASLLVADADGDGVPEIIYGDGQWGKVHAIDAGTRAEKWAVDNPEHGVSGIALSDVDLDGKKELLWGAGGTSSGSDYLYIADTATGALEWQSVHVDGPLSAVAVGDVDDDGEDEVLMVSYRSESGYDEGVIHIFNARTHALEFRQKLGIMDWMGVRSVEIADVDGDGKTEFVVTTADLYDGVIRVYDGATHLLKKQSAEYSGNYFSALAVGDVDGDGSVEIVAGAKGTYLLVLDGATLQEKWRSVNTGASWDGIYDIKLADLNGDGRREIVASCSGSRLVVYDGVTHDLKLLIQHPARALEVADIDGDGGMELLVGRTDGRVDVFAGSGLTQKRTVNTYRMTSVDALRLADLDADGKVEWLVASGGTLTVLGDTGALRWRSGDLAENLGLYNHIGIKDSDGDGRKEIYIGSQVSLYQFE